MKRLVAGLAALSACGAAFAQAPAAGNGIKVYGVADLGIARYMTDGESKTAVHSAGSGSRIGFLGGEDVGNGMRVNVRLEAGVNLDNGALSSTNGNSSRVFSRQAYIELESKQFGSFRLGRQEGPTYSFFPASDPMLMPSMDSWGVLTTLGNGAPGTATGTGKPGGFLINPTARTENTIGYISPRLSGVQARVAFSPNEDAATVGNLLEVGADYKTGALSVAGLYVKSGATKGNATVKPSNSVQEYAVSVNYRAGAVQPFFTYIHREATDQSRAANGGFTNGNSENVKLVGFIVPTSARGNVRITAGKYSAGIANADAKSVGVAYTYEVSRTLMLMAAVTHLSQDSGARYPVFQSPTPQLGESVDGVILGANFKF